MDDAFGPVALAIILGELDELRALLAADPGLATRTSSVSHPTLLQLVACEAANIVRPVDAARLLVEAGADTAPPAVAAAGCGSVAVLEFLLDSGASVEGEQAWTPLDEALYWCQEDTTAVLLRRGATAHALSTAAGLGDVDVLGEFFSFDGTLRPGAGPIGSPFADTVPADLASDPTAIVDHAFVTAVNCGRRASAEFLLERGAHVSATPPGFHWRGTALHAAVWRGDADLVTWLLERGADPSICDGMVDSPAIGWARHHGHLDLVEILERAAT